jgi:hypothetical protein
LIHFPRVLPKSNKKKEEKSTHHQTNQAIQVVISQQDTSTKHTLLSRIFENIFTNDEQVGENDGKESRSYRLQTGVDRRAL